MTNWLSRANLDFIFSVIISTGLSVVAITLLQRNMVNEGNIYT